jgi:hypothetical protein
MAPVEDKNEQCRAMLEAHSMPLHWLLRLFLSSCIACCGSAICEHDRVRRSCKICGGGSICEHSCYHLVTAAAAAHILEVSRDGACKESRRQQARPSYVGPKQLGQI